MIQDFAWSLITKQLLLCSHHQFCHDFVYQSYQAAKTGMFVMFCLEETESECSCMTTKKILSSTFTHISFVVIPAPVQCELKSYWLLLACSPAYSCELMMDSAG